MVCSVKTLKRVFSVAIGSIIDRCRPYWSGVGCVKAPWRSHAGSRGLGSTMSATVPYRRWPPKILPHLATGMRTAKVLAAAGTILCGFLVYMMLQASSRPIERYIRIHAEHWQADEPTMRLVLLSDPHVSWPGNSVSRFSDTV